MNDPVLSKFQWLDKCKRTDNALWEKAERNASVAAFQMGRDYTLRTEVQKEYDKLKLVFGDHGTYEAYLERQAQKQAEAQAQ
jgi:hypothetical protein